MISIIPPNSKNLLFSAVQFFLVLVLGAAGLFFIALPWAPRIRFKSASFLIENDGFFIPLGVILLVIAMALGMGFYFLQRRSYLRINMNPSAYLEKEVLRGLLEMYWKGRFPHDTLKTDVIFHRNQQIEFVAELPSIDSSMIENLFEEVEEEVGKLLMHQVGYRKEFTFTFQIRPLGCIAKQL